MNLLRRLFTPRPKTFDDRCEEYRAKMKRIQISHTIIPKERLGYNAWAVYVNQMTA